MVGLCTRTRKNYTYIQCSEFVDKGSHTFFWGCDQDEVNFWWKDLKVRMGFRNDFEPLTAHLLLKTNREGYMARRAGNLYQYFISRPKKHRFFVEDGLVLACPLSPCSSKRTVKELCDRRSLCQSGDSRATLVLQGHLGGRSRKGETGVAKSKSPAEHHCALEWPPNALHGLALSRPVQNGILQSTVRHHQQDRRASSSPNGEASAFQLGEIEFRMPFLI